MLSIVIPVYNESRRLEASMRQLAAILAQGSISHEVLLVVEASADNSLALAEKIAGGFPGWRAIDNQVHRGKGYAVRSGMLQARGDIICYMDADLSTDPDALFRAVEIFEKHPDLSVLAGDRRRTDSRIMRDQGKSRITLSRIFNLWARLLFPRTIKTRDTQCGFKAFRAAAAAEIFGKVRIDGFAFDVEVFVLARRCGYRLQMMPVGWKDAPHSTVRAMRHGSRMLFDLFCLRIFGTS